MDLKILENESLARHTTFKIGGNARYLVLPENIEQVKSAIDFAKKLDLPFEILGNGSNVLVSDNGYKGVIIKLTKMNDMSLNGDKLTCQSGALLSKVGNFCLEHSKTGFETLCGIPGTVGGGVFMNAGAYGGEISDILQSSTYMDLNGNIFELKKEQHDFAYRHSFYSENQQYIILNATFELGNGNYDEIKALMDDCKFKRIDKQPIEFPSAGSTFKRPVGYFAGKLVEDAGLKGYRVGGACISPKHAGFVVNDEKATCNDVLTLISYVKKQVLDKYNVELECEIKKIGD
ncbi:MAG: UDP-N-acetylmuramate dehydrogenase [Clostridia bacterium]